MNTNDKFWGSDNDFCRIELAKDCADIKVLLVEAMLTIYQHLHDKVIVNDINDHNISTFVMTLYKNYITSHKEDVYFESIMEYLTTLEKKDANIFNIQ